MCVNETYSTVRVGKHFIDKFPINIGLKQGDALSLLLFNFYLQYSIRREVSQDSLKLNVNYQLLIYVDDDNVWGGKIRAVKKYSEL